MTAHALDSLVMQIMAKAYGPMNASKEVQDLVAKLPATIQAEREELRQRSTQPATTPAASGGVNENERLKNELYTAKTRILHLQATISMQDAQFHEWKTKEAMPSNEDASHTIKEAMNDGLRAGYQFHQLRSTYGPVRRKIEDLQGSSPRNRGVARSQWDESCHILKSTGDDVNSRIAQVDARLCDIERAAETSAAVVQEIKDLIHTKDRLNKDFQRLVGPPDGSLAQHSRTQSLSQSSPAPNGDIVPSQIPPFPQRAKTAQLPAADIKRLAQPLLSLGGGLTTSGFRNPGSAGPSKTLGFHDGLFDSTTVAAPGTINTFGAVGTSLITNISNAGAVPEPMSANKRQPSGIDGSSITKRIKKEGMIRVPSGALSHDSYEAGVGVGT